MVKYGPDRIAEVKAVLRSFRLYGTAWGTDTAADQVELYVDPTVNRADLNRLRAALAAFGDAVRIEHVASATPTADVGHR